jgi:8-oxo-dGTP pyrophosphatase MutT (NUDIX family)
MDETRNPWTVLSRATPYESAWIRVDHHEVLNPAGGPGIYGTVHFKNYAIGIVPLDEKGNVILVGQYRFPLGSYSWEIPEGGGSTAVPILESAQRELREECGLVARRWQEILGMDLSNSVTDERGTAFLAWHLDVAGAAQPEDTEELQVVRVPFWQAVERAKRGEIRDSLSVAALFRVALMAFQNELPAALAEVLRANG